MKDIIVEYLLRIPIVLIALTFHEVAHGYVSYKLGDPTAKNLGRLTLNPIKHLDLFGSLCMLLFGFGWAKPVPVNARYYKNPKRGMAVVALAGPLTNVLIAFTTTPIYLGILKIGYALINNGTIKADSGFLYNLIAVASGFFYSLAYLNLGLALFNLIPIPPLDGSRIILFFLPERVYFGIMKYERYISLGLILILFLLSSRNLSPVSYLANGIMNGFEWLWGLLIKI